MSDSIVGKHEVWEYADI